MAAQFKTAVPYQPDALALPVENLTAALPFYLMVFGFRLLSQQTSPSPTAILARDDIQITLAENGGDPSQHGCFFEVSDVEEAFRELQANGLPQEEASYRTQEYGGVFYRVFFVIAPDGLCYCLGQRQT